MPWISKPSATTRIERRPEPYLTQAIKDRITRDVLPKYERKQGALMATLHAVQAEHGWLPKQSLEEIAEFLGLTPADVFDCASFYEEYWLKPKGKYLIAVCRSIACEVCGHRNVTDAFRRKLGIEVGETTDDGMFTLVELECLGSCGTAPVALVNHTLHENLSPDSAAMLIDDLKAGRVQDEHSAH